jgi:hypothetical protein
MRDINISNKLLSGKMGAKIAFDNRNNEFLKGQCAIKGGIVDLGIVANVLNLPPLKRVNFENIDIAFSLLKNIIKVSEIKLTSKDVLMDGAWDTDGKIEGVLNLKISSQLLNQFPTFKKLILLTKIKKPYIDFNFLLGGLPETVRVMWLKGEFKDKITQELPPWAKRSVENSLNKMVDELPGE